MAYGSFLMAGMTPDTPRFQLELWTVIRNVGVGLAIMPIFASGVSALPTTLTSSGSGMNNVMQRVASSVAVAVFSSLSASASAQMMHDRGLLFDAGASALPQVAAASAQGSAGLMGLYRSTNLSVADPDVQQRVLHRRHPVRGGHRLALTLRSGRPSRRGRARRGVTP